MHRAPGLWTAVFCITAFVIAAIFFMKIIPLQMLYASAPTRAHAQATMQAVAAREGWLLSDLLLQGVTATYLTVIHREHRRGQDPAQCFVIHFADFALQPCD